MSLEEIKIDGLTKDQIKALFPLEVGRRLSYKHESTGKILQEVVEELCAQEESNVDHPSHYTFGKYEVLDVLLDWYPQDPLLWQINKYIARCRHKGHALEDLRKAEFYLKKAIELEELKA